MSNFSRPVILQKVRTILANQLSVPLEQVQEHTSFVEGLGADSLDRVELVMEIEDEFEISIRDEEADKVSVVAQVVDLVATKLGA